MPTQNGNAVVDDSSHQFISFPKAPPETTTLALPKDALIQQLGLPNTEEIHQTEAGLNPLVDQAARLFTLVSKLERLQNCRQPKKLQHEILIEIQRFEENIGAQGYNAEYLLVSRYAISATLDDILSHTEWGIDGQWEPYRLLRVFNQEEREGKERFFIILERLVKEPKQYIDLLEFMYVCLCLGFKGSYRRTSFTHTQLDTICEALYQHIRTQRGDISKILSPFPIKPHKMQAPESTPKHFSPTLILLTTACAILMLFVGLSYILDTSSHHINNTLNNVSKIISKDVTHA